MADWESIFDDEEDDPREEGNDAEDVDAAEDDDLPEDADDADAADVAEDDDLPEDADDAEEAEDDDLQEDAGEDAPNCPSCGSGMVRRTARTGPNAGNDFWGCSDYPECRGTIDISSGPEDGKEGTYKDADDDAPDCPSCGSGMVRRTARTGPNAGNDFWGCSDYPECRSTIDISSGPKDNNDSPNCPDCSSGMVRRTARQGPKAGNEFWGCSNYPECRGTIDIPSTSDNAKEDAYAPDDDLPF